MTKRKKAFIGAAIGAATSIAQGLIARRAAKKQWRANQIMQNKIDAINGANNLSNAYGNTDYIEDFENKATYKLGGTHNHINYNKRYKCGGRHKAELGTETTNTSWFNKADIKQGINAGVEGVGSLIGSMIANSFNKQVNSYAPMVSSKSEIKYKLGGKKYIKPRI